MRIFLYLLINLSFLYSSWAIPIASLSPNISAPSNNILDPFVVYFDHGRITITAETPSSPRLIVSLSTVNILRLKLRAGIYAAFEQHHVEAGDTVPGNDILFSEQITGAGLNVFGLPILVWQNLIDLEYALGRYSALWHMVLHGSKVKIGIYSSQAPQSTGEPLTLIAGGEIASDGHFDFARNINETLTTGNLTLTLPSVVPQASAGLGPKVSTVL